MPAGCRRVASEVTKHCVSMWGWIPEESPECIVFFILYYRSFIFSFIFILGLFADVGKAGVAAGPSIASRHCWSKAVI